MTAKEIVETADTIRIIGTEYADIYEYSAICKKWYLQGDNIEVDYVLSSIDRSIRKQGVRIFRQYDKGIVTITIINEIGDEI